MNIVLKNMSGFSNDQQGLIEEAVMGLVSIVNWDKWQNAIKGHSFSETSDSGSIVLGKLSSGDVLIDVQEFHDLSSTLAYTYLRFGKINLNSYYLNQYLKMPRIAGEAELAKTLLHEYCHEIGYTHMHRWTRPNSVPYEVGSITRDLYNEYYNSPSHFQEFGAEAGDEAIPFSYSIA